ncbi:MAG: beta-propeller domain-containing protein [Patescibacteria group bacterium]
MKKKTLLSIIVIILIILFIITGLGSFILIKYVQNKISLPNNRNGYVFDQNIDQSDFTKFKSAEEYRSYLALAQDSYSSYYGLGSMGTTDMITNESFESLSDSAVAPKGLGESFGPQPERYSETNVQVAGIDEPDIVKTNGKEIFFSQEPYYFYDYPMVKTEGEAISPEYPSYNSTGATRVINALPPEQLAEFEKISENGDLLLQDNNLIIIGYDKITTYNVSDPKNPTQSWQITLDSTSTIQEARLFDNKIYLITSTYTYDYNCPYKLLDSPAGEYQIACTDIYHPSVPISSDTTYSVLAIDPKSGDIGQQITFVGSYDSTIYMSPNSIYVAYIMPGDFIAYFIGFIETNSTLFPDSLMEKVKKLNGYELSDSTKLMELQTIISQYLNSLNSDDRLTLENNLENKMTDYGQKHNRQLQLTQVNKISVNDFSLQAVGSFPGQLLNQFSLDEYNNYLRVATTVGNNWWGFPLSSTSESINDVYVLDQDLQITGQVLDLGVGESIYSARFIGDTGYVVTFKQTDPFYVLDLSDPEQPKKVGELKIPGYSSYLHPISDSLILGVGEEDNQVKVSLFDVSDPTKPAEKAKYNLSEYWSDVSETHHAFLLDDKHQIFFLPGSQGGYVFSYAGNNLELKQAIDNLDARRAVYINDYLYIISDQKIVVLDENTWERVKELSFS